MNGFVDWIIKQLQQLSVMAFTIERINECVKCCTKGCEPKTGQLFRNEAYRDNANGDSSN